MKRELEQKKWQHDESVPLYEENFESMIGVLIPQGEVGITKNLIGEMRWSPYADTYWKNAILLSEVEESSFVGAVPEDTTYLYGFIIPSKIVNAKQEDLKDANLPIVQELMDKFRKEGDSKTEFDDNTYVVFSQASDEARMVLVGYIK